MEIEKPKQFYLKKQEWLDMAPSFVRSGVYIHEFDFSQVQLPMETYVDRLLGDILNKGIDPGFIDQIDSMTGLINLMGHLGYGKTD